MTNTDKGIDEILQKLTGSPFYVERHAEAKLALTQLLNSEVEKARTESFIKKLQEYEIFDQQKILGGLIYRYYLESTNATTAKMELKNFSDNGKPLGTLKITAQLNQGEKNATTNL